MDISTQSIENNFDKTIALADLEVAGLEDAKKKWQEICIDGSQEEIAAATKGYIKEIELSINQPLSIILKKIQVCNLNDMVLVDRDPGKKAMERMRDEGAFGKSLHEKPKSSVHGKSLAGYIPIDQNFGKAGDSGQAERFNKIVQNRFKEQEKKENKLASYIEVLNSGKKLTKDNQRKMNELLNSDMVMAVNLKDSNDREVFGFRDGTNPPVFVYQQNGKYYYEADGLEVKDTDIGKLKKIEVLSYITGIKPNKEGKYELVAQKITGDHDQLAVGTKIARNATFQDKELIYDKGFADDVGHAITAALIEETKASGAVRHGQDSGGAGAKDSLKTSDIGLITSEFENITKLSKFIESKAIKKIFKEKLGGNPYPEDFAKGNYAIYQPNGKIDIAHNEEEIVAAYNRLEKQGYNIGINPRYGWMRNEHNELVIDPDKRSAQEFIKARASNEKFLMTHIDQSLSPKERQDRILLANFDAENIYKFCSLISLVKLQNDSPEKSKLVRKLDERLTAYEAAYTKKYNLVSPTILAISDTTKRMSKMQEQLAKSAYVKEVNFTKTRRYSDSVMYFKPTNLIENVKKIARKFSFSEGTYSTKLDDKQTNDRVEQASQIPEEMVRKAEQIVKAMEVINPASELDSNINDTKKDKPFRITNNLKNVFNKRNKVVPGR